MADLSNRGGARGGHRANAGSLNIAVPRFDPKIVIWVAQAKALARETGATSDQIIAYARTNGLIRCEDADVPHIVAMLNS